MSKPTSVLPALTWVQFPLLVILLYQCISLLMLPFAGPLLEQVYTEFSQSYQARLGVALPPLSPELVKTALWTSFGLTVAFILWLYYTRRAVLEGYRWGGISAVVIGVLSLAVFPLGTIAGLLLLLALCRRAVWEALSK